MLYLFQILKTIVLYLADLIYWITIGLFIVLYCVGYTMWFLKIPKNVIQNYHQIFEELFSDNIKKVQKEYEKEAKKINKDTFERGVDPKKAMGIGDELLRRKGELFKTIRRYLSLVFLGIFGIVALFVFFLKAMLIITGGLIIAITVIVLVTAD